MDGIRRAGRSRPDRRSGYPERPAGIPPECGRRGPSLRGRLSGPRPEAHAVPRDASYVPKDGPLPEMYEPVESPVTNLLHPKTRHNPMLKYPRVESYQPIGKVKIFPMF